MRQVRLFNTLGRELQEFRPLVPGKVGFYGCGPTVYNYAHIGNIRAYVFEDVLTRTLRYFGYEVTHVMNLTDVGHLTGDADDGEDKMVKSAMERGKTVLEIAQFVHEFGVFRLATRENASVRQCLDVRQFERAPLGHGRERVLERLAGQRLPIGIDDAARKVRIGAVHALERDEF